MPRGDGNDILQALRPAARSTSNLGVFLFAGFVFHYINAKFHSPATDVSHLGMIRELRFGPAHDVLPIPPGLLPNLVALMNLQRPVCSSAGHRCPAERGDQNCFGDSGETRLLTDTSQNLGELLILQDRDDRQLHKIAPHKREFSQSLWIAGLQQVETAAEIGTSPAPQ